MRYQIFRNNILVVEVEPDNNSELSQKKQTEDIVRLNFSLVNFVDIRIGDYIGFEKTNQIYVINKKPRVAQSPKNYKYECIFEGGLYELTKTKVFLETAKISGGFYKDYKFPLVGTAQTFLSFIVDNLNRTGSGYIAGDYKDTSSIQVEFNNFNVFDAINSISTILDFSWYLDGKTLHFKNKDYETGYVLQVGRKLGMTSLSRLRVENADVKTVIYGYGSTENLPPRTAIEGLTYDSSTLTENRLTFEGVDGGSKLENNTDKYGVIEDIKEFPIKPERIAEVTTIDTDVRVFYDSTIDFDVEDYKIEGVKPKVTFLSGTLLGLTFATSFDVVNKKFIVDYYSDESGQYPNSLQKPSVGDSYTLVDIIMPLPYITVAALKLKETTQSYLLENSDTLDAYDANIDSEWVGNNEVVFNVGDLIRIVSSPFQIDNLYEIKELTQNINNPKVYKLKFGDVIDAGLLSTLKVGNFVTQQEIFNIQNNTYNTTQASNQTTNIVNNEIAWEAL